MKLFSFSKKANEELTSQSEFSRFFREASSSERKKVFMDVARKASADQQKLIKSTH